MEEGTTASKPRPMHESYRRAHAGRYHGDGRGLYAQWICAVHRRGVRQQCVLDRRYRADCLWIVAVILPRLGVHLLPDRKPRRPATPRCMTPALSALPSAADPGYCSQMARGRRGGGAVYRGDSGHERGEKQFFPTSDRPEVLVEVQLPYGSSISQTSAAAAKLSTGCSGSGRRRLSPAISAGRAALLRRWLRNCPILLRQTGGVDRRAGCPRGAQAAAAGGGGQWPAPEARVRVTQLVFGPYSPYPVAAGDGARSARSARHRRAG